MKWSWFLGSYCLIYTGFIHVTKHFIEDFRKKWWWRTASPWFLSQPWIQQSPRYDHNTCLDHSGLILSHFTWKSLSCFWTIAASTEVLYWLAKDIIQVLLESAGRKLGTRLVLCFWKKYCSYTCKQRHYPRPSWNLPKNRRGLEK